MHLRVLGDGPESIVDAAEVHGRSIGHRNARPMHLGGRGTNRLQGRIVVEGLEGGLPVARDLDLTETALREWVNRARADRTGGKTGLTTTEREELARASFTATKGRYGSPRIHRDLVEDHQERVSGSLGD